MLDRKFRGKSAWRMVIDVIGNTCLRCGDTQGKITRDHIVPLASGGANNIGNCQPLCVECNYRKGLDVADYRTPALKQFIEYLSDIKR